MYSAKEVRAIIYREDYSFNHRKAYSFNVLNEGTLTDTSINSMLIKESQVPDVFDISLTFWRTQNSMLVSELFCTFRNIDLSEMHKQTVKIQLPKRNYHFFLELLKKFTENEFARKIEEILGTVKTASI
jgi:hypothetical protein